MWAEIQKTAKMETLHVLFMSKLALSDYSAVSEIDEISPDTFFNDEPPSDAVLNRWKLIIDMFVENGFY